jgi:hypothetical protein
MGKLACGYIKSTAQQTHVVSEQFAARLTKFFSRNILDVDTEDPDRSMRRGIYNCHTFAIEMALGIITTTRYGKSTIEHYTRNFLPTNQNLGSGQIGTINPKGQYTAMHSIIGLGEDTSDCIQVLNNNSNLGISTYKEALAIYDTPGSPFEIRTGKL